MASWGRHGWAKKDEGMRLYKERKGDYLIVFVDEDKRGSYEALANVYEGTSPSLCGTSVPYNYTYERGCKRVQWSELPDNWKQAFTNYLTDDVPFDPKAVRGFWLVKNKERV